MRCVSGGHVVGTGIVQFLPDRWLKIGFGTMMSKPDEHMSSLVTYLPGNARLPEMTASHARKCNRCGVLLSFCTRTPVCSSGHGKSNTLSVKIDDFGADERVVPSNAQMTSTVRDGGSCDPHSWLSALYICLTCTVRWLQ